MLTFELTESELKRFWATVTKSEGCWICNACPSHIYGRLFVAGKQRLAHVVSYIITHGFIEDGKVVAHSCDVPRCVRPDHLEAKTQSKNMNDMVRRGRNKPMNGTKNHLAKLTAEKVLHIRHSLANGSSTIKQLSGEFNLSFQGVYHVAIGSVWSHVGGPLIKHKEKAHFTSDDVLKMRELASSGVSSTKIAEMFDAYQGTVSKIVRGLKHKNVPMLFKQRELFSA